MRTAQVAPGCRSTQTHCQVLHLMTTVVVRHLNLSSIRPLRLLPCRAHRTATISGTRHETCAARWKSLQRWQNQVSGQASRSDHAPPAHSQHAVGTQSATTTERSNVAVLHLQMKHRGQVQATPESSHKAVGELSSRATLIIIDGMRCRDGGDVADSWRIMTKHVGCLKASLVMRTCHGGPPIHLNHAKFKP